MDQATALDTLSHIKICGELNPDGTASPKMLCELLGIDMRELATRSLHLQKKGFVSSGNGFIQITDAGCRILDDLRRRQFPIALTLLESAKADVPHPSFDPISDSLADLPATERRRVRLGLTPSALFVWQKFGNVFLKWAIGRAQSSGIDCAILDASAACEETRGRNGFGRHHVYLLICAGEARKLLSYEGDVRRPYDFALTALGKSEGLRLMDNKINKGLIGIIGRIKTPLMLAGLVIVCLYYVFQAVLTHIPTAMISDAKELLGHVLTYMFWLAMVSIVLGVICYAWVLWISQNQAIPDSAQKGKEVDKSTAGTGKGDIGHH